MSPFETLAGMIADLRALVAAQPTYRWGIVTDLNPVRVRHDGPGETPQIVESSLARVRVGDRVRVQHLGTARLVMGIRNPTAVPLAVASGVVAVPVSGTPRAGDLLVNLPAGRFSVAPHVQLTPRQAHWAVAAVTPGESAFTVYVHDVTGSSTASTVNVTWTAVQMTPTSAGG